MKSLLVVSTAAILLASPAFAEGMCSTAPQSQWRQQGDLEAQLATEGLTVLQIKSENGCYEVYAKDADGNRVNRAYNAETFELVDNPEAGEG